MGEDDLFTEKLNPKIIISKFKDNELNFFNKKPLLDIPIIKDKKILFNQINEHSLWEKILPQINKNNLDNIINFLPKKPEIINIFPEVELVKGDINGLLEFIARLPQVDNKGNMRYLLTSGVAIELITGFKRHHHDLDIVSLDPSPDYRKLGVDTVTPQKYWVGMYLDRQFLIDTAYQVKFGDEHGNPHTVATVHPAILFVQKLSDWFPHRRRPKDIEDAAHLFKYWAISLSSDPSWYPVMERALQALPHAQRKDTSNRLSLLIASISLQKSMGTIPR
ncbi:MAG: hypothetical protein V1858_05050 [Candidatus Gottesmanbacteria bacterium]